MASITQSVREIYRQTKVFGATLTAGSTWGQDVNVGFSVDQIIVRVINQMWTGEGTGPDEMLVFRASFAGANDLGVTNGNIDGQFKIGNVIDVSRLPMSFGQFKIVDLTGSPIAWTGKVAITIEFIGYD